MIAQPAIFDPLDAARIRSRYAVKAAKCHRCDGNPSWRTRPHFILPGELYQCEVFVDRRHGTFKSYRTCHWCLNREPRVFGEEGE